MPLVSASFIKAWALITGPCALVPRASYSANLGLNLVKDVEGTQCFVV